MKRYNKEYNLDNVGQVQLKLGTINKDDPKVVYVSGKCWVTPNIETNYSDVFDNVRKNVEKVIRKDVASNGFFMNKVIVYFDINPDSFVLGKKKYFGFDLYLRQNEGVKRKLKALIPEFNIAMSEICGMMLNDLENSGFSVEMAA